MTRKEVIQQLKQYFDISELVCKHVYVKFDEKSWQFFDRDFLETLLVVRRDIIKSPMIVNTWSHNSNGFTQSGLRCNICELVKAKTLKNEVYMTSHANGAAVDFHPRDMKVEQVHKLLLDNADKLPVKIRLEKGVTWVHMDTYDNGEAEKVSFFNP